MRIEFKLSMPGRASWNGGWSGEEKNYSIVRNLSAASVAKLLGDKDERYWSYSFGDGWCAGVTARVVAPGKKLRKSDGFNGYDWMVDSILAHGSILNSAQIAKLATAAGKETR